MIGARRLITAASKGGVWRVGRVGIVAQAALKARTEYFLAHFQHLTCPQAEEKKHREFEFPF